VREGTPELEALDEAVHRHMAILRRCTVSVPAHGRILLATPPDTRYPYVYPRDASCAVRLLARLAAPETAIRLGFADEAFDLVRSMARFLRDAASRDGFWGQRYDLAGADRSLYKQEDNVAHGATILACFVLAAHRLGREIEERDSYLHAIRRGLDFAFATFFDERTGLFRSTTSIHESAIEAGMTCWVNHAYLHALDLAGEAAHAADPEGILGGEARLRAKRDALREAILALLLRDGRYVRRIDPDGEVDLRPDGTLLSPFLFEADPDPATLARTARFVEDRLWDPVLGGILRYPADPNDLTVHLHAGNGPWLAYTAVLAQVHFAAGNRARGDEILRTIDLYRNERGEIPEHLTTRCRFDAFLEREWRTGVDLAKEFHPSILREDVTPDRVSEETEKMSRAYESITRQAPMPGTARCEGGVLAFATPLAWSHVETMRALLLRAARRPPAVWLDSHRGLG